MIKNLKKKLGCKKGFTLIELIVVIAILGILATIAVPRLTNLQNNARIDADITTAKTIANMAKVYIAQENLSTDTEINAVVIAKLETAKLIDAGLKTQTTKTAFVLTVTGGSTTPVFTITDGTDQIIPSAAGKFLKK